MDALFITLIVTMPIIGIGVLIWFWVRRSPTPAVAARRRAVLYSLCIVFVIAAWLREPIARSRLYRSIVGISTVAFANESGAPLQEIEVVMRAADGGQHTYRFGPLRDGRREHFPVRTSDLLLERLTCLRGTQQLAYTEIGLATRGEVFLVKLDSAGRFTSSHE